ncbi:MAG: hypothetical protein K2H16_01610 [Prevotella sp.]|nr:hypothetical protein [Prevotella sp.]
MPFKELLKSIVMATPHWPSNDIITMGMLIYTLLPFDMNYEYGKALTTINSTIDKLPKRPK